MSVAPDELETLWSRLSTADGVQRRFVSLRIDDAGTLDVHAALRTADRSPCLLFDMLDPSAVGDIDFEVGGMRCARSATDTGQSLVLSLEDPARRDLFATLCSDVLAYAATESAVRSLPAVLTRLDAWRLFLRSLSDGLSRSEIIGLIGELRVLLEFLENDATLLNVWRAPENGLHDFENDGHALEVKATLGPGTYVTISHLHQLDDGGLDRLDLVHVRLYETPQGDSVDDLVGSISSLLPDSDAQRHFSNALLRRGLSPDDRRARTGLRTAVQQFAAFHVTSETPRILRADVPLAITEVRYTLELAQLASSAEPWSLARTRFTERSH